MDPQSNQPNQNSENLPPPTPDGLNQQPTPTTDATNQGQAPDPSNDYSAPQQADDAANTTAPVTATPYDESPAQPSVSPVPTTYTENQPDLPQVAEVSPSTSSPANTETAGEGFNSDSPNSPGVTASQPVVTSSEPTQNPVQSPFGQQAQPTQPTVGTGFAVASLVLGIISVIPPAPLMPFVNIISMLLGALAITFGLLHLNKLKKAAASAGKGMAVAGTVTGVIALLVSVAITGLAVFALSSIGNNNASSVEVNEYGNVNSEAVSDNINTSTTTRAEAESFLGGNPECESRGASSESCTFVGGNLEKGLVVVLDFDGDKISGIQTSYSSFTIE